MTPEDLRNNITYRVKLNSLWSKHKGFHLQYVGNTTPVNIEALDAEFSIRDFFFNNEEEFGEEFPMRFYFDLIEINFTKVHIFRIVSSITPEIVISDELMFIPEPMIAWNDIEIIKTAREYTFACGSTIKYFETVEQQQHAERKFIRELQDAIKRTEMFSTDLLPLIELSSTTKGLTEEEIAEEQEKQRTFMTNLAIEKLNTRMSREEQDRNVSIVLQTNAKLKTDLEAQRDQYLSLLDSITINDNLLETQLARFATFISLMRTEVYSVLADFAAANPEVGNIPTFDSLLSDAGFIVS